MDTDNSKSEKEGHPRGVSDLKRWLGRKTEGMMSPVICSYCREIYDLTKVEVVHRYADCTLFKTPCCYRKADDRSWKGMPDYTELKDANIVNQMGELTFAP